MFRRWIPPKNQVKIWHNDDIVNCNLFEVKDSDVDEANTETNIIDESGDKGDFISIE